MGEPGSARGRRSASTIRFELREAERSLEEWQRRVEALQAGMAASSGDHESLASLGVGLAEAVVRRDSAEDRWLELSLELDERLA